LTLPWRRIVLVGFMGAGKTSVGARLARRLRWRYVDLDRVIEEEAGRPVARIFDEQGEAVFRRLEAAAAERALAADRVVLVPGGGWAAVPGRLEALPEGTASVWLEVSAEEAVRRVAAEPGRRPLLDVDDPVAAARALLEQRGPSYGAAAFRVDTERSTLEDVTARILEILRADPPESHTD
jgi:shikimate kinase